MLFMDPPFSLTVYERRHSYSMFMGRSFWDPAFGSLWLLKSWITVRYPSCFLFSLRFPLLAGERISRARGGVGGVVLQVKLLQTRKEIV